MPVRDPAEIRAALEERVSAARGDAIRSAVLTVLLSALLVGVAVLILTVAIRAESDGGVPKTKAARAVVTLVNFLVGYMFLALVAGQSLGPGARLWLGGAALIFVLLLGLSYLTPLPRSAPAIFWFLYAIFAFVLLALLGRAYSVREDYYLGWWGGRLNNPFRLRDDVDRAHVALGFIVAVPRMIVGSYGDVFAGAWLWKGLSPSELGAASETLHALGGIDPALPQKRLRAVGEVAALRIIRWFDKLRLVRLEEGRLRLTDEGERLIGTGTVF